MRGRLQKTYGAQRVPDGKPIPAQLLGNMWAQQWGEIYPLVEPYPGVSDLDVTAALKKQKYDAVRITQSAEAFYVSLGFPKLPQTFWERSLLTKPRDRDVQCHASAWHMDGKDDVRIKQCIEPTQEHLMTVYHELGHLFYDLSYNKQPYMFQGAAHDGFHEAIGDTVNLSMTPAYLHQIGLIGAVKQSREATINQQMKLALDKVAFLPFGKLIDEWRWKVFAGEVKPENYNAAWWQLREQYQGVAAPVARSEEDFDPGAKYHIPANTPYTRYFLSYILQFQFHRALCEAAGNKGPLYECSVYGNAEAGKRFREMLALGQSQPWQDTLEKLTGTRADGCLGDPRLLRTAPGLAGGTEQRQQLRLVITNECNHRQLEPGSQRAAIVGARDRPLDRARHGARRGEHLSRTVRRPDDRHGDSRGGGVDGGAALVRRRPHPREQHRADRRVRGRVDLRGRDLHAAGAGDHRVLEGLQLLVGARDRRPRRRARRAVLGAAASRADRRAEPGVPGRQGSRGSAQGRREPRPRHSHSRDLGAARRRSPRSSRRAA